MSLPAELIREEFEPTVPFALECLWSFRESVANVPPEELYDILEDCQDAFAALFAEQVLLHAWRETRKTAGSIAALITAAHEKITNDSFIAVIIEAENKRLDVPFALQPLHDTVRMMVQQSSANVERKLAQHQSGLKRRGKKRNAARTRHLSFA